jgi:DNA-directed RNA polymerase subunit RPC12/RpoP
MALIECKECGHKVSDEAKACPSCGAKVPQPPGRLKVLFWGLVIIFTLKSIFDGSETNSYKASTTYTPQTQKSEPFGDMLNFSLTAIKSSLKDPSSLILESVLIEKDGRSSCITYRAKNSFGGYERKITIFADGKIHQANQKNLDKYCTENMQDATAIAKM